MMKEDNRNLLLAITLSVVVLLGWQYFYGVPQAEKQKQIAQQGQHPASRRRARPARPRRPR
jgi:YidC/Oxa1 family membrane protein insertase